MELTTLEAHVGNLAMPVIGMGNLLKGNLLWVIDKDNLRKRNGSLAAKEVVYSLHTVNSSYTINFLICVSH